MGWGEKYKKPTTGTPWGGPPQFDRPAEKPTPVEKPDTEEKVDGEESGEMKTPEDTPNTSV